MGEIKMGYHCKLRIVSLYKEKILDESFLSYSCSFLPIQ